MAVISITISESELHKVAGIPDSVVLTTNVPATIFFTLDGTTPSTSSPVATGIIKLPGNEGTITLKAFATDGVTTSPVITQSYGTTTVGDRHPRDKISGLNELKNTAVFPFGSRDPGGPGIYDNTGGITVDSPDVTGIPDGFDGSGTGAHSNVTDKPLQDYELVFSETNALGETGKGIGTLPAQATIVVPDPELPLSVASGSPIAESPFFNPKSLVIFQDASMPPYDPEVSQVMRPFFSLEDATRARDGALLSTSAFDGGSPRGTVLKQQYNPRDNMITFYYRDADTNRWIISKVPFTPRATDTNNLSQMVFGRNKGVGSVFQWLPFRYRTLW